MILDSVFNKAIPISDGADHPAAAGPTIRLRTGGAS